MRHMDTYGIKRAVEQVGSQVSLARLIEVSPQFVSQLVKGVRPVPAALAGKIEAATGGQVTRQDLRPDIFGDPSEVAA